MQPYVLSGSRGPDDRDIFGRGRKLRLNADLRIEDLTAGPRLEGLWLLVGVRDGIHRRQRIRYAG